MLLVTSDTYQVFIVIDHSLLDLQSFGLDVRRPDLNGDKMSGPVIVDASHSFIRSNRSNVHVHLVVRVAVVVNAVSGPVEATLPVPVNTFDPNENGQHLRNHL